MVEWGEIRVREWVGRFVVELGAGVGQWFAVRAVEQNETCLGAEGAA